MQIVYLREPISTVPHAIDTSTAGHMCESAKKLFRNSYGQSAGTIMLIIKISGQGSIVAAKRIVSN